MNTWTAREIALRDQVEAGKAVVANTRTDDALVEWATERGLATHVDRRGEWGNPHRMKREADRDDVCDRHREDLLADAGRVAKCGELRGRVLVCWCAPKRCHADTLAEIANGGRK